LNSNKLGFDGAKIISATIEKCLLLKALHVRRNNFGDEGVILLANAICAAPSCRLQKLSIGDNDCKPETEQEVQKIVNDAIKAGTTVKAFGARHSQSDIICTEGIPIDNHGLKFYQMNADNTVTLGAGVTLKEATKFLRTKGRAFKITPQFGNCHYLKFLLLFFLFY